MSYQAQHLRIGWNNQERSGFASVIVTDQEEI